MKIHPLSAKAKELMLEFGAESCVILLVLPSADGETWDSESGAAIDTNHGLTWHVVESALADAVSDVVKTPVTPQDKPS